MTYGGKETPQSAEFTSNNVLMREMRSATTIAKIGAGAFMVGFLFDIFYWIVIIIQANIEAENYDSVLFLSAFTSTFSNFGGLCQTIAIVVIIIGVYKLLTFLPPDKRQLYPGACIVLGCVIVIQIIAVTVSTFLIYTEALNMNRVFASAITLFVARFLTTALVAISLILLAIALNNLKALGMNTWFMISPFVLAVLSVVILATFILTMILASKEPLNPALSNALINSFYIANIVYSLAGVGAFLEFFFALNRVTPSEFLFMPKDFSSGSDNWQR